MLDVHPPHHAANTFRDFLIHIATIVVGLLIAVGLEQSVEFLHHRHEVAETREALHAEREANLAAYARSVAEFHRQSASLVNNLTVLHYLQQHPGTTKAQLPGILVWHAIRVNFSESAWRTAQQSNVTALMPQDEVRTYAQLYDRIDSVNKTFDVIWPPLVQARLYGILDADPTHLNSAEIAQEIDLTNSVLLATFTQAAALVQLSGADPGFTPTVGRDDLNSAMHATEIENDPTFAAAIAATNQRLPADAQLPIPAAK